MSSAACVLPPSPAACVFSLLGFDGPYVRLNFGLGFVFGAGGGILDPHLTRTNISHIIGAQCVSPSRCDTGSAAVIAKLIDDFAIRDKNRRPLSLRIDDRDCSHDVWDVRFIVRCIMQCAFVDLLLLIQAKSRFWPFVFLGVASADVNHVRRYHPRKQCAGRS